MKVKSVCLGLVSAMAQVTSDGTSNTTVNSIGNNFTILNGLNKGDNLFHSFSNFSVPTGGAVKFDLSNTPNIITIFSRVTGGNISNIDGLIQTLNSKNAVSLFLMNPNGIIFGANAKLDISGSFVGTTANSIKFSDGVEFKVADTTTPPLLTMGVPVGLQMGSNAAAIQVQGTGYVTKPSSSTPIAGSSGLQVKPGKTLALVGGNIQLNDAVLTAKQGHVELGGVGSGTVSLTPDAKGYTFGYRQMQSFGDIQLAQKSLLDISGVNAGSVQLQGKHIQLTNSSMILSQNFGYLPGGDINFQASEAIDIIGGATTNNINIRSAVRSETLGIGAGSNINIVTPHLSIQDGAGLNSISLGTAPGGNINIDATALSVSGFSSFSPVAVTTLVTSAYGSGNAGDISINGDNLMVSNGAALSSVTFSPGSSGKVTIRNTDITVQGDNPAGLYSNISSITYGIGSAKKLTIDTARLQIQDGGAIAGSSFFAGQAGDVTVNATESIIINGRSKLNNSSINSSVLSPGEVLRQQLQIPARLTGNAGHVSVRTPNLTLTNGGTVSVTSQGSGNGGSLNITADNIQLKNQGLIQAQTESGDGGNIALQVRSLLLMRDRSNITATAGGSGDGGNININAPLITGLENSDIIANAVRGRGGSIQIATQGIIGLQYRPQTTAENDITASSQFGVSGTVQVNNIGVDPNSGLVELPENITDPSQQIASGCSANQGSKFVATGRGGIPQNPNQEMRSDRTWSDIRNISAYRQNRAVTAQIPEFPQTLVQATGWHRNAQGKIELLADKSSTQVQQTLTCAGITR
jgi:filamentous hemagglutinin family protein